MSGLPLDRPLDRCARLGSASARDTLQRTGARAGVP